MSDIREGVEPAPSFWEAIRKLEELHLEVTSILHEVAEAAPERRDLRTSLIFLRRHIKTAASDAVAQLEEERQRLRSEVTRLQGIEAVLESEILQVERAAIADGFEPHGFFVYLLLDRDGDPLYVGRSENVLARLGNHLGGPRRRWKVHTVSLIRCRDLRHADQLEGELIRHHRPPWNIAGVPDREGRSPVAAQANPAQNIDELAAY